ncbi:MAG TPA: hypothetical protein VEX69_09980 [Candidatus Limnocylindria bacterium]|nr:hypothetical protein [Candidatus Limnocylindria bacterium]
MSKLTNWGHSLVAALFVASGASALWYWIEDLATAFRQDPQHITYHFIFGAVLWATTLCCAWGIFRWRPWGRMLGIVLSALCFVVYAVAFVKARDLDWAMALIYFAMLTWLLLPNVRAEYLRRAQVA